jgi:acyl-CoA thioester hydrolase
VNIRQAGRALRLADFPRHISVQTRYADLDPQRHVNNAAIGVVLAEARSQLAREIFDATCGKDDFVFMVGQFAVSYLGQVHHPDPCDIGVATMETGAKTVRVGQGLFQRGQCLAVAESLLIGTRAGRPAVLPDAVRAAWDALAVRDGLIPRQLA